MFRRRQRSTQAHLWVTALLIFVSPSCFGQELGTLTLTEGKLALIRGTMAYTAGQGVRLQSGDILAVDSKGQAQVEFTDGAILNLAQGSRAMLLGSIRGEAEIAVQSGWAKFTQRKSDKGARYRYQMPIARFGTGEATGVLHPGDEFSEIFLESGAGRLVELNKEGEPASGRDVKSGEFVVRRDGQPITVAPRPSSEFLKSMPGHFMDDLPVLIGRFKTRRAEPRPEHEASYAEVETWLKASPPIRKNFTDRFLSRTKDAEFRKKLIENLKEHPEWDRILFPEKYEPKDRNEL